MKLKTTELTALLSKAIKASSNNRLIPITSLIKLEAKDGTLTLETTDSVNYLYVSQQIGCEDFYAVVETSTLYALVSKLTCEDVELVNDNSVLVVKCGVKSSYKLPMQLDENGNVIKYPSPIEKYTELADGIKIRPEMFRRAVETCKASLSNEINEMGINQYFFGENKVISTDSIRVSCLDNFELTPFGSYVLNQTFVALICASHEDELELKLSTDYAIVESPTYNIVCTNLSNAEKYPNIMPFLSDKFAYEGECVVDKNKMVEVLERIALFTSPLSKNVIHLNFTDTGIEISTPNSSGIDVITYTESVSFTPFNCDVVITLLLDALKTFNKSTVTLSYANDTLLRLTCDNATQLMCLTIN